MDPLKIFLIFAMVAVLFAMLSAEKMRPARPFPFYRGWIGIGLGVMVVFVALANGWSVVIPSNWLREHRLLHGEVLGTGGSIVVWYVFRCVQYFRRLLVSSLTASFFSRVANAASSASRSSAGRHPQRLSGASARCYRIHHAQYSGFGFFSGPQSACRRHCQRASVFPVFVSPLECADAEVGRVFHSKTRRTYSSSSTRCSFR